MKNYHFYVLTLFLILISCKEAEETRGDEDEAFSEEAVNQPVQHPVSTADIVLPAGYSVEAVNTGLTYPVDVTFDEEENYYGAEAGGHIYGTKPPRAPEARILRVSRDGHVEVLYNRMVPMTETKEAESSEDMQEGLILL